MARGRLGLGAASVVMSLAVAALALAALPVAAQDDEDEGPSITLPGSGREAPIYALEDDVLVLEDRDWCENLIALTEEVDARGRFVQAETDRVELCTAFLERLGQNGVALLPLSLAQQVVELPEELLVTGALPSFAPSAEVVTTSGRGQTSSETFTLLGGDFRAVPSTDIACAFFTAFLTKADGDAIAEVQVAATLLGVEPGDYAWNVFAPDCDWAIELHSLD